MHGHFRRRNLPHWHVSGATYFVTACLAGSLPARGTLAVARRQNTAGTFRAFDACLDAAAAVRWLVDPRLAAVVDEAVRYQDGRTCRVIAHVIMPSHCHVVFDTSMSVDAAPAALEQIMGQFKRHTARACNRILGRTGSFWQAESYDRVVRDADELERVVRYVENNPVKAGLCERPERWRWSSAYVP
ncbi:MAG: REP-associated tyrosine transposase [Planctomycetaceae bacterium]